MRVPPGLVFVRETRRSSKRLRTTLTRSLLALLPVTLVVAVSITVRTNDLSQIGGAGRDLFVYFSMLLIVFALTVPPVAGAMGVHAEREEGTLDLLRLTHLSLRRVLDGVISARLAGVILALAGAAPALALITTLGGVGPAEVAYLAGSVIAVAVYVGWTAALLACTMRGVAGPVAVTWGSLLVMLSVACCVGCAMLGSSTLLSGGGPPSPEPISFVVGLLLTPVPGVLWSRWIAADTLERSMYGETVDTDDLTWQRRLGARRAAAALLLLATLCGVPLATVLSTVGLGTWYWLAPLVCMSLMLATSQVITIEVAAAFSMVRRRPIDRDPELDWRGSLHRGVMRRLRGHVGGNPVAWRETMTTGAGSALPFLLITVAAWAAAGATAVSALGAIATGATQLAKVTAATPAAIAYSALFLAPLILPLIASASWTPDRRFGTATVLLQTSLGSTRFMWGKLLAYAARILPAALGACVAHVVMLWLTRPSIVSVWSVAQLALGVAAILLWLLALGGICHLLAARVRPTRTVWMIGGGVMLIIAYGPICLAGVTDDLTVCLTPLLLLNGELEFGVLHALAACVGWAMVAAMSWGLLAARLETWMTHDRP